MTHYIAFQRRFNLFCRSNKNRHITKQNSIDLISSMCCPLRVLEGPRGCPCRYLNSSLARSTHASLLSLHISSLTSPVGVLCCSPLYPISLRLLVSLFEGNTVQPLLSNLVHAVEHSEVSQMLDEKNTMLCGRAELRRYEAGLAITVVSRIDDKHYVSVRVCG